MLLPAGVRIERLREPWVRGALEVKNAGWRDTYLPWLGPEYLDRLDAALEETAAAWSAALADGRLLPTWVALDAAETVIGVSAGGPVAVTQAVPRGLPGGADGVVAAERQLSVLYVDASWRGRGIAEALTESVLEGASAFLWVLEDNPRARGFYAKAGFVADGAAEELPAEWNGAREIRMVRA